MLVLLPLCLSTAQRCEYNLGAFRETWLTLASSLYTGTNSLGQVVLTWVATTPATEFTADVSPFVTQLAKYGGPTTGVFLGYVSFGSETLSSNTNVTLSVPKLSMSVLST